MSEFWDWAVAAYARPGVAEACLDLQDTYAQNVPLLLWAAWRGGDVARAVVVARQWEDGVIAPLRTARRRLKAPLAGDNAARMAVRDKVKAAELDAERALMTALEALAAEVGLTIHARLQSAALAWGGMACDDALANLAQLLDSGKA